MADEPLTIRGIQWREALPVTNLFRSFRVAIHPSKVLLALVALLGVYIAGRALDAAWPDSQRAIPNEISAYEQFQSHPTTDAHSFAEYREQAKQAIEANYAAMLLQYHVVGSSDAATEAARERSHLGDLKSAILKQREATAAAARSQYETQRSSASQINNSVDRERAITDIKLTCDRATQHAYTAASQVYHQAEEVKLEGIFDHYFQYESNQINNVVRGVRDWNWLSHGSPAELDLSSLPTNALSTEHPMVAEPETPPGVLSSVYRFFAVGPVWLLSQHPLYFVAFGIIFLAIWAVFGGAISRIAAVHVARDEKMSIRSALMFSINKFLSFLFAPLIPVIIIAVIGGVVTLASLVVGNIPVIGPILVGALFFLVLVAGFVMALVMLGLIGGFNMMYPTIAVEGSDSFDAISRSFSYLYARPWRLALYTVVAVIYGALTYLFVRLFIFLMLVLAHKFVGFGMLTRADSTAPLWSTMWPNPTTASRLSYDIDFLTLTDPQKIGAFFVSFWVYLTISVLGAFAISFYFSSSTIIYYLMRREVDATELDDVYLEQVDDDFGDTPPVEPTPPAPVAPAVTPVTPVPADGEPAAEVNPPT